MSLALSVMLQTTIVLVFAALLTLSLRRSSASLKHVLWTVALFAALIVPLVAAVLPGMEVAVLPEGSGDGTIGEILVTASSNALSASPPIDTVRNSLVRPNPPRSWSWQLPIAAVWMAGTLIVLIRLLLGSLAVRRLGKNAEPVDRSDWLDIVNGVRAQLRIRRSVELKLGEKSIPPMTWGLFHHVILLPASALDWSADRRRLVLAHELAHVKRRDGILQILVQVVCGLYWFNPLVWYAARQLRIERECACDNEVLKLGADADDYADHLLQVARAVSPGTLSMAAVAMAQRSQLEMRLLSILDTRTHRNRVSPAMAALLTLALVLWTLPAAAIRMTARPGDLPPRVATGPLTVVPKFLSQAAGVVQGVVMQVGTGVPLKDVLVSLTPVEAGEGLQQRYDVETRTDGTFAVTDLPPGEYRMNLVHDDYVRLHSQSEPLRVTVGDGRSHGMRLQMMPGPAISGRIDDENGAPRTSVPVDLLKMEAKDGARSLQPTDFSVLTDEHGEYRFFGLEPGEYYLRSRPRPGTTGMPPVYYPGVTDVQHATPISVRAGADITGINLALTKGNLHSVRLRVALATPAPAHPELSFYVNPQSRHGGATTSAGMPFDLAADGTYRSPLLAPGTYEIEVYLKDPDPVRWARTTVNIEDSDVDAGTVVIPQGTRIQGRVNVAEDVFIPVRKDQLHVVLRPLDGAIFVLPSAKVDEDGNFVLTRVPDRRFRVEVTGLAPEVYLGAIQLGGRDVRGPLKFGADSGSQLELSIANAGGAVAGVVRNAKDQPVANGHVVLFPTSRANSRSKEDATPLKTAFTDQFGAFSIGGIAPGEYGILAWQSSERARLDTPYLMAIENHISKVLVERGFTNTVNVKAVPPSN